MRTIWTSFFCIRVRGVKICLWVQKDRPELCTNPKNSVHPSTFSQTLIRYARREEKRGLPGYFQTREGVRPICPEKRKMDFSFFLNLRKLFQTRGSQSEKKPDLDS